MLLADNCTFRGTTYTWNGVHFEKVYFPCYSNPIINARNITSTKMFKDS